VKKAKQPTRRRNTSKRYPKDAATKYALDVVAGRQIAGPHVRNACKRHLNDLDTADARGLEWDLTAVTRALGFFPDVLRLNGGQFEGKPFVLHPAQAFKVGSIFGWKWRATGLRRFRRAFIEEGKGNGKSPLAAGIGLYALVADDEPRAEIYAAATKKDQAMILFRDAVAMVKQSSALRQRLQFSGGAGKEWNIAHLDSGSWFRALSSDDGQSGPRPHVGLCDEVHEAKSGHTIEMIERGFKFREQPLLLMITNSGTDRKSVCWEEHCHAILVAAGDKEDDTSFSYVCALDEGDDPLDPIKGPECWAKANPLLGTILTEEYLAGVAKQARDMLGKRNNILRLHFCVWTDADSAWMKRETWEAAEDPEMCIEDFAGQRAWFGLDLGATKDMTGLAMLFDDGQTEEGLPKFALFARGFMPEEGLAERAKEDQAPYDLWAELGWIVTTPGAVVRLDWVAQRLINFAIDGDLQQLAFDMWLFKRFAEELDAMGVELPLAEHPQGYSRRRDSNLFMPDSVNKFEELLLDGRLRVEPNPALRSAVMSARFEESPAGLRRFSKSKAAARIDLAVASAMSVGAATSNETDTSTVYQARGVLVL
jgi:phage terminase large subunit-like protein